MEKLSPSLTSGKYPVVLKRGKGQIEVAGR